MDNLLAFAWPPFPHPSIGGNQIGDQPTVGNKAKSNWNNVLKSQVDCLSKIIAISLYLNMTN